MKASQSTGQSSETIENLCPHFDLLKEVFFNRPKYTFGGLDTDAPSSKKYKINCIKYECTSIENCFLIGKQNDDNVAGHVDAELETSVDCSEVFVKNNTGTIPAKSNLWKNRKLTQNKTPSKTNVLEELRNLQKERHEHNKELLSEFVSANKELALENAKATGNVLKDIFGSFFNKK